MASLDTVYADLDQRAAKFRELAVYAEKAAVTNPNLAAYESAGSPFGGGLFGNNVGSSALKQYRAAMRDTPAMAIRPIAVKVADQVVRAGIKRGTARPSRTMRTKCYDLAASNFIVKRAPLHIKAISESIDVLESHPILDAIENPNAYFSQWALMYCTAYSMEATGESIWVLDPTVDEMGNPALRIYYYPRHWVEPVHNEAGIYSAWKLTPPGVASDLPPIPANLVVHFFYPDPSNPLGAYSPVQSQSKSINVESLIRDAHEAAMQNSIEPGLILRAGSMDAPPGQSGTGPRIELTPEQRKQIIEAVKLVYRGVRRWGDPLILDRLIEDAKPYRQAAKDLDLQGGYSLTRDAITQGIGTNPIIAGMVEGVNYASSYVAQENNFTYKVNPLITCMSQTMTRSFNRLDVIRESSGGLLQVWIEEAKPHSAELRLAEMSFLAEKNWLDPNEAREAFDMPPIPELTDEWEERRKNPPVPPMPGTPTQGKPPPNGQNGNQNGNGQPKQQRGFDPRQPRISSGRWGTGEQVLIDQLLRGLEPLICGSRPNGSAGQNSDANHVVE